MIQQRVGDLLEIQYKGTFSYVVVLTKKVMFGGNIVFAYHTDGKKRTLEYLFRHDSGFNICTDLLLPKRHGHVSRLHHFDDLTQFWRTRFVKGTNEIRLGVKAKEWFIYRIDKLGGKYLARLRDLTPEYREAMDSGCHGFDLVVEMIKQRYTPDQNEHL